MGAGLSASTEIYLEPNGVSGRELAEKLHVARSNLSRVLKGSSRVTPESWLVMQDAHDLWIARKLVDQCSVGKLKLIAA